MKSRLLSPVESHGPSPAGGSGQPAESADARTERLLAEIRDKLDEQLRAARHRPPNLYGLVALLAQLFAAAFIALALVDFLRAHDPFGQLLKIGFASVFQLVVISAKLAGRGE